MAGAPLGTNPLAAYTRGPLPALENDLDGVVVLRYSRIPIWYSRLQRTLRYRRQRCTSFWRSPGVIEPKLDIPTSEEAWVVVQSHGEMHDLVKRAAFLLGGSYNIRTSADPELTRVRFAKVYDDLRRKEVDAQLAAGIRAQRMRLEKKAS